MVFSLVSVFDEANTSNYTLTVERLMALRLAIDKGDYDHGLLLVGVLSEIPLVSSSDHLAPLVFSSFYAAACNGYDCLLEPIWMLCENELRERLLTSLDDRAQPTVFHAAASLNRPSTLRQLFRLAERDLFQSRKMVEYTDLHGFTPLMVAAAKGLSAVIDVLLRNYADPLSTDLYNNMTAVDWAVMSENQSTADRLIKSISPSNREKFVHSRVEQFKALNTVPVDIQRFHDLTRMLIYLTLNSDTNYFVLNHEVFLVVTGADLYASCDCASTALLFLCASAMVAGNQTQAFRDPALLHLRMRQTVDFALRKIHAFVIGQFRTVTLAATLPIQMILHYYTLPTPFNVFLDNWPELRELTLDSWCLVVKALEIYGQSRHDFPFPDPKLRTAAFKAWKHYERYIRPHLRNFFARHGLAWPRDQHNTSRLDDRPTPDLIDLSFSSIDDLCFPSTYQEPTFMNWQAVFSRLSESPINHPLASTKLVSGLLMPQDVDDILDGIDDESLTIIENVVDDEYADECMVYPLFKTKTLDCDPDVSFKDCWTYMIKVNKLAQSEPGSPGGVPVEQRKTYAQACDDTTEPSETIVTTCNDERSGLVECYLDVLHKCQMEMYTSTQYDPFNPDLSDLSTEAIIENTIQLYHERFKDKTLPSETAELLRQMKGFHEQDERHLIAAGLKIEPIGKVNVGSVICSRFQTNFKPLLELPPTDLIIPEAKEDLKVFVPKCSDYDLGHSYFGGRVTLAFAEIGERKDVFVAVREVPRGDVADFCVRRLQDFTRMRLEGTHLLGYREFLNTDESWILARDVCDWNLDQFLHEGPLNDSDDMIKETRPLIYHLMKGLQFLHSRTTTMFHGNLKPSNLLIDSNRILRLVDFGFGKLCTLPHGYTGPCETGHNTLHPVCWKPPEYYDVSTTYSGSSDVHSAAMLSFYMLTKGNRHPFIIDRYMNAKCLKENIRLGMHDLGNELPVEAVHLLNQMLQVDPSKRPESNQILDHPFFWPVHKRWSFLVALANWLELDVSLQRLLNERQNEENLSQDSFCGGDWRKMLEPILLDSVDVEIEPNVTNLLRFIRRCARRCGQLSKTKGCSEACQPSFFLNKFPSLLVKVYDVITTTSSDHLCHMNNPPLFFTSH